MGSFALLVFLIGGPSVLGNQEGTFGYSHTNLLLSTRVKGSLEPSELLRLFGEPQVLSIAPQPPKQLTAFDDVGPARQSSLGGGLGNSEEYLPVSNLSPQVAEE